MKEKENKIKILDFVESFLWSYNISELDLEENKDRIITNILNYGNKKAVDWLFETYSKDEIKYYIKHPLPGEWSKKSLNFWAFIAKVNPNIKKRSDYVLQDSK